MSRRYYIIVVLTCIEYLNKSIFRFGSIYAEDDVLITY